MSRAFIGLAFLWVMMTALIGPAIIIPAGQRIVGDVSTYTDNIRVDGEVTGNVTSWSGNIIINGSVGGDVVSYTGAVTLMSNAKVTGSTMTLSSHVQRSPLAQVRGQTFSSVGVGRVVRPVVSIFTSGSPDASGISRIALATTSTLFGALLLVSVLSIAGVWPQRSRAAALVLQQMPVRSFLLGLFIFVVIAALTPLVVATLASTLVGLPVAMLILVLANMICAYGLTVLIQVARETIEHSVGTKQDFSLTMIFLSIALVLPIILIGLVAPLAALVLFYLMACPGLGATALMERLRRQELHA